MFPGFKIQDSGGNFLNPGLVLDSRSFSQNLESWIQKLCKLCKVFWIQDFIYLYQIILAFTDDLSTILNLYIIINIYTHMISLSYLSMPKCYQNTVNTSEIWSSVDLGRLQVYVYIYIYIWYPSRNYCQTPTMSISHKTTGRYFGFLCVLFVFLMIWSLGLYI